MKGFLDKTIYCDFDHEVIQKIAQEFRLRYPNKRDLAKQLFYFVRNETKYCVGNWSCKASDTLAKKQGTCTNSANLLVALCRACDIPAGYGVMKVAGPEYFGPIALPNLAKHISKVSRHIYVFIFLDDKWVKCDPSDDAALSLNTQHLNPQSKVVEWDGVNDAMLNLDSNHIIEDIGPLENIDYLLKKRQRLSLYIPVTLANLYIEFLRIEGRYIKNINEIESRFVAWLKKNNKLFFFLYKYVISNFVVDNIKLLLNLFKSSKKQD